MKVFNADPAGADLPLKVLIRFAETQAVTANLVKEYFVWALLEDENVLSQVCESAPAVGSSLKSAALEDLNALWKGMSGGALDGYTPSMKRALSFADYQRSLESIVASDTPERMLDALTAHYRAFGAGKNARYIAFHWQNGLNGVETPDDIRLEELFCLDSQKEALTRNTSLFLRGLPASNALLYGDSGSGKSSMVKALLNRYSPDGLRLAEIPKTALAELPRLMEALKNKNFKYIVFLDDLSYEPGETGYKDLKVVLEGQIAKQPMNVLLYATSNRRHLISETWAERQGDEVHVRDAMNEKFSLAERFGLRVGFSAPDQNTYFQMIR